MAKNIAIAILIVKNSEETVVSAAASHDRQTG